MKTILRRMIVTMALFGAVMGLTAAPALAGGNDTCTTGACYTVPAVPTTTTSTSSSTSVSIHIKKVWKTTERIRQFEKHKNVVVLVNVRAGGVKSQRGCVDPMSKGWIGAGQYFDNSGGNHRGYFTDRWKVGRTICNATRRKIGNTWYMVGWKDNCSNHIRIRISGPSVFKKYVPVIEVRSLREFTKMYEEWYNQKTSSTGSTTTSTSYSCVQGTLVNGNMCQICPPPVCTPTPPPPGQAPATLVKYVHENGNKVVTQSIFGFTKNGSGFTNTGESTNLGSYQIGSSLTVCETNAMGYTSNKTCETQTIVAGGNTFVFTNSKTTSAPPADRRCTISARAEKTDPYTAYVTVDTEGTGTPNTTFNWGDGTSAGGTFSGIHTYPKPAPGPAGSGVTYTITVTAVFADGQTRSCGSRAFFVPAPPPNGNTGPPPPPGG